MAYKPLDLSFLANQLSANRDSMANTAAMILANAGWNNPSQAGLKEFAEAKKKAEQEAKSLHRQTFLSSVFDALQTPLYGVANALDEALAGHQEDSNDSVLSDIAKTAGGVGTGLARGISAGLRGGSGILDVLPGVDINDEWQSNPTDKTHFSDVAIRQATGLSTKDALNPENWERIKPKLKAINDKSVWDKTFFELFVPENLDSANAQEKYLRNQMLAGIPADVLGDPLNLVLFGGGAARSAAKATKGITEGVDAARASEGVNKAILSGLNSKAARSFTPKADLNAAPPIGSIAETLPEGVKFGVNAISPTAQKGYKSLATLGRREIPKQGLEIPIKAQKAIVKEIATLAATGEKGWLYKAADILRRNGKVQWTETEKFLQTADRAIRSKGLKHNPEKMAPVLADKIRQDVEAARKTGEVERRVMNTVTDVVIRPGAPKLKTSEARLANQVVRKFENEILGRGRAPGTGEGLARAIASGNNVRYSGPQQARMWNQITSSLKFADARKFDKATRILRAVEDYFITKGMIPHSAAKTAESVPLRLSQVAEAIGPQSLGASHQFITRLLRGDPKALATLTPEQIQAIEALKASEAFASAPAVQRGISQAKIAAEGFKNSPLSVGRKAEQINRSVRQIKEFTAAQGAGDVGAKVVGEYMGNLLGRTDPINRALSANRLKTEAWLSKAGRGKIGIANDPEFVRSVTNAISRAANLPSPASLSGAVGSAARVKDWLGARFNAAYGVQDMRTIFLAQQASAMSTTGRRARIINELGRRFNPSDADLWHEAFRAAQQNGVTSGRVAGLQSEIAKTMENLFGGTGLRSGAIADSTVVGRNRLLLDELNTNLKRFGLGQYQFTNKTVKLADGTTMDFSKGLDWMKSWEAWDVKSPYEFLHKVQNAIEFTVREKNMFDEIISRFSSPVKKGAVKYGVNHPRLRGFYFTEEGAKQAQIFVRMLEEVSTPNSKALQHFDHVLSKLKAALTIYIPGHHWTNLIGDTYFNWIAGVNKPVRYDQAMKVMLAQKGRYGEFAEVGKFNANSLEALTGPKALEQAVLRSVVKPDAGLSIPAAGNKVIITMQNGTKLTADMIFTAAFKEGILPSARVLEDVTSDVSTVLDKFKPLGGKGQRSVHKISEIRDHIPRLAQFIDGLAKHKGSFTEAATSSARSVRKWHPDGLDLTKFERNVMKRVFPFYSWTRKAIPLAIEATVFAGPKVMAYPRLMEAIALSNGISSEDGVSEPFPTDQMFPDWVRDRGIGPILGGPGNYTVVNPSTPVLDTLALIGHPGQSAIDMLNPMGRVPIEVAQGQTLGRNVPIGVSNQAWMDYAAKQIPIASQLGRASGQFGVSDSTKEEGFPNWVNIINLITGAKAVNTGKYQKSAQFDIRDYLKEKREQ